MRLRPCIRSDQSSTRSDGRDTRTRASSVARRRSGSQPDTRECKGCRKKISKAIKHPLKCVECKAPFHDNHSGESRSARDKIRKYNKAWTCPYCRLGIDPPERRLSDTANTANTLVNAWQLDVDSVKSSVETTTSNAQHAKVSSTKRSHAVK